MVINTVQDMHIAVDKGVQNLGSFIHDFFEPEEIDLVLNLMQDRVIIDRVFPESDEKKLGLEETQKRLDDIRVLIVDDYSDKTNPIQYPTRKDVSFGLPRNYKHRLSTEVVFLDYSCGGQERVRKLTIEKHTDAVDHKSNPFARSNPDGVVKGTMSKNFIRIPQTESITVIGFKMAYVRLPREISLSLGQDCELPQHVKNDIVTLSIKHILEQIESRRYQSNSVESLEKE